jgi:hypothetical protein
MGKIGEQSIPDEYIPILAARYEPLIIRAESHAVDGTIMGLEVQHCIADIDPDVTVTDAPVFTGIRKAGSILVIR